MTLKRDLIRAFAVLDAWFDKDERLHHYQPPGEDLRTLQILERIVITNNDLLSLINNGCKEAVRKAKDKGAAFHYDYKASDVTVDDHTVHVFLEDLHLDIKHSEQLPSIAMMREELRDQLYRALCQLELLHNGEGLLHVTTMPEKAYRKMDIYQLTSLLGANIWKQLQQLERYETKFNEQAVSQ